MTRAQALSRMPRMSAEWLPRLESEAERHARWNTPEAIRIRANRVHNWPQWALNALLAGELKAQGPNVAARAAALHLGPNAADEHHNLAHEWYVYETTKPDYPWRKEAQRD